MTAPGVAFLTEAPLWQVHLILRTNIHALLQSLVVLGAVPAFLAPALDLIVLLHAIALLVGLVQVAVLLAQWLAGLLPVAEVVVGLAGLAEAADPVVIRCANAAAYTFLEVLVAAALGHTVATQTNEPIRAVQRHTEPILLLGTLWAPSQAGPMI